MTFREFFRLVFCMLRARILLLFEAFAGGFPRPCAVIDMFFLWVSKVTFREFFWLVFWMLRARILLLFEAFGGGFPRPCAVRDMFFMDSKGDVLRVF